MQTKILFYAAVITSTFTVYSCNNNSTSQTQLKDSNTSVAADTTAASTVAVPGSNYNTGAAGQTRAAAIKTTTPYQVEKLAEKIGRPWAIIPMPDGKLLLTEKSGYMEIRNADGSLVKKITGFPKVDDRGQGGMLDVALDPSFTTNQIIYWSFSEKKGSVNLLAVAKGKLDINDTVIKNPVVIFRATPALNSEYHFGSRLLFDKDGFLFVTSGERSILEGRKQSQWLNSGLGKIFRITTNGKAAPGNPFINKAGAKPEIYSYGHRNPQSMDAHPVTGELWAAEFGPQGGDELNLVKPGKNYGWPIITYGVEYSGKKIGDSIQQKEGMEQPVYFWDPVLSPGGMIFYTADAIPEWKNNLFICGLSSTRVVRLVIENNKVVGEEVLLNDQRERMRDIAQLNGMLYVVSDGGILFRISKK